MGTTSGDCPSQACRPVQLCGWLCELGGGLVCGKEGMVLQSPWQGLPRSSWWVCDCSSLRLQRWLRQLDGRLVCGEEGMVLPAWRQRLPRSDSWVCLGCVRKGTGDKSSCVVSVQVERCELPGAGASAPSSGA